IRCRGVIAPGCLPPNPRSCVPSRLACGPWVVLAMSYPLEPALVLLDLSFLGKAGDLAGEQEQVIQLPAPRFSLVALDQGPGLGFGADLDALGIIINELTRVGIDLQDADGQALLEGLDFFLAQALDLLAFLLGELDRGPPVPRLPAQPLQLLPI